MRKEKSFCFILSIVLLMLCNQMVAAQTEAVFDQTLGVGCIVIPISPQDVPAMLGVGGIQIYEQNNRVLYPVIEVREVPKAVTSTFQNAKRPIGRLVGSILEQTGSSATIYFLFTGGQAPLNITIIGNQPTQKTIVPVQRPIRYHQLLNEWWGRYNKDASPLLQANDHPPVVKEYLRTMLAFRLRLSKVTQKPPIWHKLFYTELGFQLDPTIALFEAQSNLFFEPEQYFLKADQPLPTSLAELIANQNPQATSRIDGSDLDLYTQAGMGDMLRLNKTPVAGPDVSLENTNVTSMYEPVSYQSDAQNADAGNPKRSKQTDLTRQDLAEKKAVWDSLTQAFSYVTGQASGTVKPGSDAQSQYETDNVEPIAFHVPAHCFYIRFGSYSNFMWFQETTTLWGGDMRNLVALRALNNRAGERLEQQIGLRQDALAKLFGDSVIDDVAVIGTDLFFDDGASFGLLFRAKNSGTLANDFNSKRKELLKKYQGSTEQTLEIQDQKVSFISTPDQRIRTYYAAMGDYHLVARSEQLIRDFIALHVQQGKREKAEKEKVGDGNEIKAGSFNKFLSLGELNEFQQIREIMPTERKETIFLYFSRPYFYNIVSPAYWVETQRRETAAAGIELVRFGSMAAAAEGNNHGDDPNGWLQMLKTNGYIPPAFGKLPDGSHTIIESWSDIRDSLRGYRGFFVPIADLLPKNVTTAEYIAYQKMCQRFFEQWGNLDPVVVSIMRTPMTSPEGKTEHIVIDARMAPLSKKNGESLRKQVGQPMQQKLAPVQGNISSFEVALANQFFFGALQNDVPPRGPKEQVRPLERIASGIMLQDSQMMLSDLLAGYLGSIGEPGQILKLWNIAFQPRDDAYGYSKSIDGTWRRHFGEYTLYSRQRAILDAIAPQLGFVPAEYAAQLRLRADNPLTSRIAPILNNVGYARTCDTSRGNIRLLNDLQMQFHISGPHCKDVAEQILGAELVCPLGGTYQFQPFAGTAVPLAGRWTSTALVGIVDQGSFATQPPAGFIAPPLNWFRGGRLDTLVSSDAVSIHAEVNMLLPSKKKK